MEDRSPGAIVATSSRSRPSFWQRFRRRCGRVCGVGGRRESEDCSFDTTVIPSPGGTGGIASHNAGSTITRGHLTTLSENDFYNSLSVGESLLDLTVGTRDSCSKSSSSSRGASCVVQEASFSGSRNTAK
ncbi:unnamed protein product, partial [Amoebophrya sp. A120]|eukprot:GSA120T00020449001.1